MAENNYKIHIVRERSSYIEAIVIKNDESVLMQWTCDSAFRFFPLVQHEELGLTLHPFDLATNKVLALVGRLEVRDWIDLINCHSSIHIIDFLPVEEAGKSVLDSDGKLFFGDIQELSRSIDSKLIKFHTGSIQGAFPSFLK